MFATAESLALRGELAIDPRFLDDGIPVNPSAKVGPDGRAYSKYGLGWPAVLAAVLAVAAALGLPPGSATVQAALLALNPLLSALTAWLAFAVARELGAGRRGAVALGVGGTLATFAWPTGVSDGADPLLALLVTCALWRRRCATRGRSRLPTRGSPARRWARPSSPSRQWSCGTWRRAGGRHRAARRRGSWRSPRPSPRGGLRPRHRGRPRPAALVQPGAMGIAAGLRLQRARADRRTRRGPVAARRWESTRACCGTRPSRRSEVPPRWQGGGVTPRGRRPPASARWRCW